MAERQRNDEEEKNKNREEKKKKHGEEKRTREKEEREKKKKEWTVGRPEMGLANVEWVVVDEADVLFGKGLLFAYGPLVAHENTNRSGFPANYQDASCGHQRRQRTSCIRSAKRVYNNSQGCSNYHTSR